MTDHVLLYPMWPPRLRLGLTGCVLAGLVAVTGCATHTSQAPGTRIVEAGRQARSDDPQDRLVAGKADKADSDTTVSIEWSGTASATAEVATMRHRNHTGIGGGPWHTTWLWLERRLPERSVRSKYSTEPGWGLGVAGVDAGHALRATAFVSPVDWRSEPSHNLTDPWVFGWTVHGMGRRRLVGALDVAAGIGLTGGILVWDYEQTRYQGDDPIEADSLSYVGLVAPLALQTEVGPLFTELALEPTVRFAAESSGAGFHNGLTRVHTAAPVVLRLGVAY